MTAFARKSRQEARSATHALCALILGGCLLALGSCNLIPDTWADAITGASKAMALDGNSLYHQTDEISLESGELEVAGEVKSPGKVNLNNHYKREVFIKEALYYRDTGTEFIGSYRYRGYSLFDLLHPFSQEKKNAEEFRPAIDLYVVIENDLGETVAFSWSEIFHTINPHQVLIATEVAPIVPYRKEVGYPVGDKWKVVSAGDLFAWRTLENPVRITVRSFDKKSYPIDRDLEPMHSQYIRVVYDGAPDREGMDWSAAGGARLHEGVARRPDVLDGLQVLPEEVTAAAVWFVLPGSTGTGRYLVSANCSTGPTRCSRSLRCQRTLWMEGTTGFFIRQTFMPTALINLWLRFIFSWSKVFHFPDRCG